MSLVELIGRADDRSLAASAVACLDRCLPLLEYVDGADRLGLDTDLALRPLWSAVEGDDAWLGRLRRVAAVVERVAGHAPGELAGFARRMAAAVPAAYTGPELRAWAEESSTAVLEVHLRLDGAAELGDGVRAKAYLSGETDGITPLTAGELRRQTELLEMLADDSGCGLSNALRLSNEGKRVLRAAASRRARSQG
ncbi:hypothetical protein [Streptomyces sp. H27-C3]|uniref:hypothetical protein n=1 Tax=Streptomyces sp. H27-C3 TaxID=3046305 RepID=UPI0024B8F416|nr:hypothetical protein [Streptomyces sp. H27-C3]MDJ0464089.1 hypothetical protein [Streptomyces sp. H27-C3]